jgi:cytosine/adenosine deaminase-related metal-dependent hydrolase
MLYRARYAMTADGPLIENAVLEVQQDKVVSMGPASGRLPADVVDLGDVLLLPGLINAHAHLGLTFLQGKVPYDGCFARWTASLVRMARAGGERQVEESAAEGILRSLRAGVTTVGDIVYDRRQIEGLASSPLRAVCFVETLGIGRDSNLGLRRLEERRGGIDSSPPDMWIGVSPHAPYSTDARVYREAISCAGRNGWRVCTHLAETREEEEFLRAGTGPLRGFLEELGLVDDSFPAPGCSPVGFAEQVGLLESDALLVHLNYVTDRELEMVAGSECSVVFCPRSHRFFGHEPHRISEMLALGVNVCLGTDSLASNDSLSILDEWRFLHREYPGMDFATLLRLSTTNAARALGIDGVVGSLERGKLADFIVVPMTGRSPEDATAEILETAVQPSAVYIGGERVHS